MFKVPEAERITKGMFASPEGSLMGAFVVTLKKHVRALTIASNQEGWEHVSVSLPDYERCPTWPEMCQVKDMFWDEDDAVMQLHPPASDHVNNHQYCLHLWRPIGIDIPLPPSYMVGYKALGTLK